MTSCKEITWTAKDRKSGSIGFAEALLIFYNKKSRFGLEWSKLYAKKKGTGTSTEQNDVEPASGEDDAADHISRNTESLKLGQMNLFSTQG